MSFIEEFAKFRLYFIFLQFSHYCCQRRSLWAIFTAEKSLVYILILSESHMGYLNWVKFVEIPKQKFESQLNVIYLFFILW